MKRPLTWMVLLACFVLSGCDNSKDQRVHLTIWHSKSGGERDLFASQIQRYETAHPGVAVEALYREPEDMRNLYVIAAVAGQGPDLVYGAADNVGVFETTQTIRPVTDILPPEYLAGFIDESIVKWKGKSWLVGDQIGNQLALICNRAEVPNPPHTLDELIKLGQSLTKDTNGDGTPDRYGLTWNYREPYFFIPFLTAFGGWVMDDQGRPTLDTPQTVAALQFILDLRDKYHIIPKEGDYEIAQMLFKEGRAAMIINGPWAWADYHIPQESTVAPLPINSSNGLACASMFAAKGYSVNVNVPEGKKAAVRDLLLYLTGSDVQREMAEKALTTPVRREVIDSDVVQGNPTLMASMEQIRHSRPIPIQPQMRQIWDGMRGPYQLVMSGAVTAREGARLMQRECEKKIADSNL